MNKLSNLIIYLEQLYFELAMKERKEYNEPLDKEKKDKSRKRKISIINVNNYKLRIINVPEADYIWGVCILNQNMLLTGDQSKIIRQWRIEGDNLILISKKEKAHDDDITDLLNLGNGHIASCSWDKTIKIW